MYATCLFCNNALGTNEVLEHFPVGRRLAFDAAKGRLWAICGGCKRWNLSPLETRWEAIEEAERAYCNTKLRTATANIGLARLREGLELVRIGAPERPEFAAWRYGDQFGGRYKKAVALTYGAIGLSFVMSATNFAASALGLGAAALIPTSMLLMTSLTLSTARRYGLWKAQHLPSLAVRDDEGTLLHLTRANALQATIFPDGNGLDWQLAVPHVDKRSAVGWSRLMGNREVAGNEYWPKRITGDPALRALATLLPTLNVGGGSKRTVSDAVDVLHDAPELGTLLRGGVVKQGDSNKYFRLTREQTYIKLFPAHIRLAMEMSVHEDDERRAMEGELAELEQRWKDADAIAKIADEMFLPSHENDEVEKLKAHGESPRRNL